MARIAALMAALPATAIQAAREIGCADETARDWLRQLRALGVVTRLPVPVESGYVFELEPSRPYEREAMSTCETLRRLVLVWRAFTRRQSVDAVARNIGARLHTTQKHVAVLRRAGLLRVAGWEMRGQCLTPLYDRVRGADCQRPPRMPRAETNARYWAANGARFRRCGSGEVRA